MSGVRFLVVDDGEDALWLLTLLLEAAFAQADPQVEIVGVLDGETALRKLTEEGPFDLLITDANLPRVHGLELLRRTRAIGMNLPAIFMSANPSYAREGFLGGANYFISKPIDGDELIGQVRDLLARSGKLDF